jgi:hypothetical protein
MKCKNCGLPKDVHIPTPGVGARVVFNCPNGSGNTYPAIAEIPVELLYQAGENHPWTVRWTSPSAGTRQVFSDQPLEALERAGREIEKGFEEKTEEEKNVERAIEETRHRGS